MANAEEWNREKVISFIEEYREFPELWDPQNKDYYLKNKKHDAWQQIATNLQCEINVAKNKMKSLLSSFRRERTKIKSTMFTGQEGRKDVYISTWFAFKSFSFLLDKNKPFYHLNNENNLEEEEQEVYSLEEENNNPDSDANSSISIINSPPKKIKKIHNNNRKINSSPAKTKTKKLNTIEDPRVDYAFQMLKNVSSKEKDECQTFGEHIITKLKKLDDKTQAIAMHQINNIMFEIEMEYLNNKSK
ncbi:uncharacterized protein [Prorops nasuta]|uniref:uncharacterized protein n=1 Tax=Prorops nasuta TaxID=863751 RepID=UPI0034CE9B6C